MKKPEISHRSTKTDKLPLRSETIRILTERELTLVVAGDCIYASLATQKTATNAAGVCS
jgi:hypothetical protein